MHYLMVGWDWYGLHKKRVETRYAKHVYLHVVGSMGHLVQFGASASQNINALFFMLGWDWYGFHKKRIATRYAELVFLNLVEYASHIVHFGVSGA
jgi:hypothetical protein